MAQTALITLLAALAALAACGLYGRERLWEKGKSAPVDLADLATVRAPEGLRYGPHRKLPHGDSEPYEFERVYKHHLNGTASLAEKLTLTIHAEDLPLEPGEGRWQWSVKAETYQRDPVTEPSWRIRLLDRQNKVELDWRGFQKHYTVETAKRNLQFMAESIVTHNRKAWFQARRDWPTDGWQDNLARNLPRVQRELAALGMPPAVEGRWTAYGDLRYTIDHNRPQHLTIALLLGAEPKPSYPVDFNGPVTKYTFVEGRVWQDNQGSGGHQLAKPELERLRAEWTEPGYVYYYSFQTLNLWGTLRDGVTERIAAARKLQSEYRAGTLVSESPRY